MILPIERIKYWLWKRKMERKCKSENKWNYCEEGEVIQAYGGRKLEEHIDYT